MVNDEPPTYEVDPYDLDTARDVLLHTGGFSRSLIALYAEVLVTEYDRMCKQKEAVLALCRDAIKLPTLDDPRPADDSISPRAVLRAMGETW